MKVPFDETATIDYLTGQEERDAFWGTYRLGNTPRIIPVTELAKLFKGQVDDSQKLKEFKRPIINIILKVLFGVLFILLIGNNLINHTEAGSAASLFLPLLILLVFIAILTDIFNKAENL